MAVLFGKESFLVLHRDKVFFWRGFLFFVSFGGFFSSPELEHYVAFLFVLILNNPKKKVLHFLDVLQAAGVYLKSTVSFQ